jgi:hypothetical protein
MTAQPKTADPGMQARLSAMVRQLDIVERGIADLDPCYLINLDACEAFDAFFESLEVCNDYMGVFRCTGPRVCYQDFDGNEGRYAYAASRYISRIAEEFCNIDWALDSGNDDPAYHDDVIEVVTDNGFLRSFETLEKMIRPYLDDVRLRACEKIKELSQLLIDAQKIR